MLCNLPTRHQSTRLVSLWQPAVRVPHQGRGMSNIRIKWWPRNERVGLMPELAVYTKGWIFSIRFGRPTWRVFSERYQGQHGIPRRRIYLFGERLTLRAERIKTY